MKIRLVCTSTGFVPETDEDYEKKRKLKCGSVYEVTVKYARNAKFHRKYFQLIHCAWEYVGEQLQEQFANDVNVFRKAVEVSAGNFDYVYVPSMKKWVEAPKSISFDSMSQEDFEKLYDRVKDVLYLYFIPDVNKDEFEKQLMYF